jgi:N,N'-diacetylchitobiose transport system permease protein
VSRPGRQVLLNGLGLLAALLFAFPVYWMVNTAFKGPDQIQTYVPVFIPTPTLDNFVEAINQPHFIDFLRNSALVTLATVALATVVGFLAARPWPGSGSGRARLPAPRRHCPDGPFEALLIPFFLVVRDIGLYNQLPSLVLIYFIFTLPFTIWSLRGFVAASPSTSRRADGRRRDPLRRVHARHPAAPAPGLVATSIFCFITAWNEYFYAFVFMTDVQNYTLPVWLGSFRTNFGTDWGATMAASTLFTLPVLLFFLAVQRRMVGGLTSGAVKG